jgi:hypothetical protein
MDGRGLVASSVTAATITAVGIREVAEAAVAATLNATAEIFRDDHHDHDKQPCAERPGIGANDVEQLPHARILHRQEQTDRKAAPSKFEMLTPECALSALQHFINFASGPGLTCRDHSHTALICSIQQHMRTHLIAARLQVQIRLRLPAQRRCKIASEDLPARSVVKLDDVAFRMHAYLHSAPKSR